MPENSNKIQEIQILEQNLHNLLFQKQAFQIELAETESALKELKSSGDEIFKVIGQLMIKTDKKKTLEELSKKKELLELRIKAIEKQEFAFSNRINELREEMLSKNKNK